MKSDAAPSRIIYRVCKQVICIDEHRRGHDHERPQEYLPIADPGDRRWHGNVNEQVRDCPDHRYPVPLQQGIKKAAQKLGGILSRRCFRRRKCVRRMIQTSMF
jgi:hypothetical protein